jgi:hypothetical protein
MTPVQYIKQNPNFVVRNLGQYRSSNGVLTVVEIDGRNVSWNALNTPALRSHLKNDSTLNFYKWLKAYMLKQIAKIPDDQEWILNADIKYTTRE